MYHHYPHHYVYTHLQRSTNNQDPRLLKRSAPATHHQHYPTAHYVYVTTRYFPSSGQEFQRLKRAEEALLNATITPVDLHEDEYIDG